MSGRAFHSSTFQKTPHAPHVGSHGGYKAAHVLSPKQFSSRGVGYRFRQTVGSTRIMLSKGGVRISTGAGGFRSTAGGKLSHVSPKH